MLFDDVTRVYKFKSINSHLYEMLETGKLFAPSIDKLNDPFESTIYIKKIDGRTINKNQFKKLFQSSINSNNSRNLSNNLESYAYNYYMNEVKNNLNSNLDENNVFDFYQKLATYMGVISFTLDNKSLLLWSHYGDSHRGVCLEFKRSRDSNLNDDFFSFPVRYSSLITDIKLSLTSKDMIAEFFKYKADLWSYEKEWRYITPEMNKEIKFPGRLVGIYFGLKTSNDKINEIMRKTGNKIKYYKAYKLENRYEIKYKRLDYTPRN